eukprot:scaffold1896_cov121-Isochrysis_galbana.AAC.3
MPVTTIDWLRPVSRSCLYAAAPTEKMCGLGAPSSSSSRGRAVCRDARHRGWGVGWGWASPYEPQHRGVRRASYGVERIR